MVVRLNKNIIGLVALTVASNVVAKAESTSVELKPEMMQQFEAAMAADGGRKIAFINTAEAGRDWVAAQEISKEIKEKEEELTRALQDKQRKFAQAHADYEKKKKVLKEDALKAEEKKLAKMAEEFESFKQECQEEWTTLTQQRSEQLDRDLRAVVAEIGKQLQVDAIVDIASGRVLYASDRVNMTHIVVDSMNKNHEQKLAQAAEKGEMVKGLNKTARA